MADTERSGSHPLTLTSIDGAEKLQVRVALLHVMDGPDRGAELPVEAEPVVIGGGETCDLRLADPTVSSRHVEIALTARGFLLRDLGSKNGTHVNGLRVDRAYLAPGATVRLGGSTLEVLEADQVQEYELSPRRRFGRLVGGSLPMRRLYATAESAASTDLTVLLEGETGTGKGLVAEEIHRQSARADGPLQVFDCGSVPPELVESELFGHVKGAFTGAVSDQVGLVESADGGTLFLDEVGELPLELQPKLLRLLEARQFMRVGDPRLRTVDVRFIAATNLPLDVEVAQGRFRQDLYYRLAVIRLRVPALRERIEDLPALVNHLARAISPEAAVEIGGLVPLLSNHLWPGNVRELRNVVERLTLLPPSEALPTPVRPSEPIENLFDYHAARERALDQFERVFVTSLLQQTGGNITRAAEIAGVSRRYVTRLMTKHGIDRRSVVSDPES
jgi:DNA-binding NtrC family response regulator